MKKAQDNGITLIALIITIIVMLILAGVTISIIVNGGLFTQANEAARLTDVETTKEHIQVELISEIIEKKDKIAEEDINNVLDKYTSSGTATIKDGKISFADLKTEKGNEFELKSMSVLGAEGEASAEE